MARRLAFFTWSWSTLAAFGLLSVPASAQDDSSPQGPAGSPESTARTSEAPAPPEAASGEATQTSPLVEAPASPAEKAEQYYGDLLGRPAGLRSDQAAQQAYAYAPEALVHQGSEESAQAKIGELTYRYVPKVTLSASYTRQSRAGERGFGDRNLVTTTEPPGALTFGDPLQAVEGSTVAVNPPPNLYYLNAGMVIPLSDYLLNMSKAFAEVRAEKNAAQLNEEASRQLAAADARLLYYDWVRSRLSQSEAEQSLERAQALLQVLKDMEEAGRARRADVARQEAFVARAKLDVRHTETQEVIARQQLHTAMTGGAGNVPTWEIGEDVLRRQPGDQPKVVDLDQLYREAVKNRLEIQALDSTVYSLTKSKEVEGSAGLPRLEGFGNLTYANPNRRFFPLLPEWNGSWDVGARLTFVLNDLGSSRAKVKGAEAEISKVRARKRLLEDSLRSEVHSALMSLEKANLACDTASEAVDAAVVSYVDRKSLFEQGLATTFELLDAETTLVKSRLDFVDAFVGLRMARVRFDHALGRFPRGE